jgi:two-component system cell cycle sensor histidine kinase/response regulator CckA
MGTDSIKRRTQPVLWALLRVARDGEDAILPGYWPAATLLGASLALVGWLFVHGRFSAVEAAVAILLFGLAIASYVERGALRQEVRRLEKDRRRLEKDADNRTRYLDALILNSPLATVVLDSEHRVRMCNPAFERLFQYPQEEVIGTHLDDLIADAEELAKAEDNTRRVYGGEMVHLTTTRRRRDGSHLQVELYGVPLLQDGALVGIFALYEDVTDRYNAELALKESEERFRRLSDATFEGIVVSDDGLVVDCNEQYARMFGLGPAEVLGRRVLDFVAPEHQAMVEERIRAGYEQTYEHRAVRADGGGLIVEVHGRSIPLNGRSLRVAAVRDVTAHRRFEEEVRQAQKMEAVGRLAGGIAHDFNNVLTVIKGYSQLVLMQVEDERLRRQIDEIRVAAERASLMTQRLLAFGRKQPLLPEIVDLTAVVNGMEPMLRRLIRADIAFDLRLAPALGPIKADPGQLEQVVLNLAINAGDAMPRGGTLTIETTAVELKEAAPTIPAGSYVAMAVRDTGTGMDDSTLRQAFEPFFTTKQKGKGTGLGLATVYTIVQQNGGTIDVESKLGAGTTFRILFPRVPTVEASAPLIPAASALPRGSETVLVVEDEPGVRAIALEFLVRQGYRVLEADNGASALKVFDAEKERIDLVLTDVVMPGMNGPEMVEALLDREPRLRVLFMSGYTDDVLGPKRLTTWRLVQKPFSAEELLLKLREALDERPGPAI